MRNHGEKHKDMIESVLPSRARKAARQDRRLLHHQARARQRTALAVVAAGQDDEGVDFREGRRKSALKSFVRDRRDADNVGALTRWAAATVRADPALRSAPVREQVAYFAAILPAGLIGRHAVSHIEAALEFGGRSSFWPGYRARLDAWHAEREAGLRAALRQILAEGRHGELNRALRRAHAASLAAWPRREAATLPLRLLLGAHDIDAFSAYAAAHSWADETLRELTAQDRPASR